MGDENPYDSDHVSQENCDILADTVGPESHSNPSEKESKHKCCTCKIKTHAGDYDKISTQSFECIGISPSYHYKNLSNLSDQNFHKELKKLVWFHKTEVDIQLYDEALKKLQHENDKLLDLLNNYNKKIKDDIDAYCNKIWSFIKEYFHYDAKEKSQEEINAYEEFINKRNLLQKLEEECKKKKAKASGLHNKIRTISQGPHILSMNHTIKALEKRVEQLTDDNERIMSILNSSRPQAVYEPKVPFYSVMPREKSAKLEMIPFECDLASPGIMRRSILCKRVPGTSHDKTPKRVKFHDLSPELPELSEFKSVRQDPDDINVESSSQSIEMCDIFYLKGED